MVISYMCVFLQRSIYPRTAAASFFVTMAGATPYKLFLKVPWSSSSLPALISLSGGDERPLV
jgi:hypothetical protein